MQWRHPNVFNKECVIVCVLSRGRRGDDGKVYRVTQPWEWHVSFDNVVWVGADENEMNWRIGHNYLTVFPDLTSNRLLLATPGKDASVWQAFAAELLRHNGNPKALQDVAIDMSAAHVSGVSDNFGNAQVVYDKFHVIQYVVEACDQIRKIESRADARKRDQLERTRWIWRKNRVNWTAKEALKWESMARERCVTGMAYEMRLVLQGIYERKDVEEARKLFGNWCAWVRAMREQTGELLEPMARVARMIEGHLEGILVPRYFQWKGGGLDGWRMMATDDTGTDLWTVAGAWEELEGGGVAV